jgi:hypothetical protein
MYEIFRRSAQDEPLSKALFFREYDVRAFEGQLTKLWKRAADCILPAGSA